MGPLAGILCKPIPVTPRTRVYQEALDQQIDRLKTVWDLGRGLLGTKGARLPHEEIPGYWQLPEEERRRRTPPGVEKLYDANAGRAGTAPLAHAAFCWRSPLSRHHRDPELLRFFQAGLAYHTGAIREDGATAAHGLNGESWAHGWDVEGLIYGLVLCGDALDPAAVERARGRFRLAAARFARLPGVFSAIGSYGNQRCVYILGLHLYGQYLEDPELIRLSDSLWADALPKVLDESGQVIEQHGPCMHYSYTAFIYAWLNLAVRGDESQLDRVARCLDWFRSRHTESMYPLAGPSTRQYYETATGMIGDLWPAAEQAARRDLSLRDFVDCGMARAQDLKREQPDEAFDARICLGAGSHGASILMWAMLMAGAEKTKPQTASATRSVTTYYEATTLHRRCPLKYLLVRRDYQTHVNLNDFLPFSGVQTWALGDEPPIIHPTPLAPSTTQACGLDTARQGVSHNWGLFGAGAMASDGWLIEPKRQGDIAFLVVRYDWLWRLVFFTERSTVQVDFGHGGGPRRTLWTLNRVEPAEPQIGENIVKFAGRRGCLHSTIAAPKLLSRDAADEWLTSVRQLEYDCGAGAAAFALSDDSFRFDGPLPPERTFRFSDAAGRYEAVLDERFFGDNPGNVRVDPYQLAHGTTARRSQG